MNYKMLLLMLTFFWFGCFNPTWAASTLSQECLEVRAEYKMTKSLILQSCQEEKSILKNAQQVCTNTSTPILAPHIMIFPFPLPGSGLNVWNPYCHTPCDQPTPITGNFQRDSEGAAAHDYLCFARWGFEMCKIDREIALEELQDYVNEVCCPYWPCKQ